MDLRHEAQTPLSAAMEAFSIQAARAHCNLGLLVLVPVLLLSDIRPVDCLDSLKLVARARLDVRHGKHAYKHNRSHRSRNPAPSEAGQKEHGRQERNEAQRAPGVMAPKRPGMQAQPRSHKPWRPT